MLLIQDIGNGIHSSIQLEVDFPSNHENRKIPILDLKVWIEKHETHTVIMHEYTTFTDRAQEDWAEIWGERNFFLYTNTYEYGWLIVTIVGYFACLSSFSVVICYYLLICDLADLGRVFSQNFYEYFRLTAHRSRVTL